ncbi:MAG: glycoside hydrolase family 2 TIM barrel-domain containing protein [Bacteroidales bacterium]
MKYPANRSISIPSTISLILMACSLFPLSGQVKVIPSYTSERSVVNLNEGWKFHQGGTEFAYNRKIVDDTWAVTDLPHTWNSVDPFDDKDGYFRGIGWYRKEIIIPDTLQGKRFHLRFEGANQVADVYVNGMFAGRHQGGYTAFAMDITRFLSTGEEPNLLAVSVSNAHDPFIPPLSVGFALYGGIYRDVELVITEPLHFSMSDKGSSGIYLFTSDVSNQSASLSSRIVICNNFYHQVDAELTIAVRDQNGMVIATQNSSIRVGPEVTEVISTEPLVIEQPMLWSPEHPYLYTVDYVISTADVSLDRLDFPLGIRTIALQPDGGFYLNGKRVFLKGTNRHQDFKGKGSALSNEDHVKDLVNIRKMGSNFVRLAHYPQDPAVLRACDSLGLLVWEEIPLVNYIMPDTRFYENSMEMLQEMIRQHFNHPSVVMWGSMNEIFLWGNNAQRMSVQFDPEYTELVRQLAVNLDSTIRTEDPSRLTAMAIHGSRDYEKYGLTGISDVLGLNIYSGWYSGEFSHFSGTIRKSLMRFPGQAILVSEYGAGSDPYLNAVHPERFDFSVQYQQEFNESYLAQIESLDQLTGVAIWNQFDFSQPWTGGSIPHLNQKGMVSWDRNPKDVYYLYKANWSKEPFIHIASREWQLRTGTRNKKDVLAEQPLKIYTNCTDAELFVNGRTMGSKKPDLTGKALWMVDLEEGINEITAQAISENEKFSDKIEIAVVSLLADLRKMESQDVDIAVNCGSNAQYYKGYDVAWLPDKPFTRGSYGYTGGDRKMLQKDIALTNTDDPALYFQYLEAPESYRFDLPDGNYMVECWVAEPDMRSENRVFEIIPGNAPPIQVITRSRNPLSVEGNIIRLKVGASNGNGITIKFRPVDGLPLLSAIRVRAVPGKQPVT